MIHVIKSEVEHKRYYEENNGISQTVPDMDEPVAQMLQRFRRGDDVHTRRPIFNGDTELPDMRKMDYTDVAEYSKNVKNQVSKHKKDVETTTQKIRKAKNDAQKSAIKSQTDEGVTTV